MKKMLAILLGIFAAALLLVGGVRIYHQKYPISADNSNLVEYASAFLMRKVPPDYQADVKIYDSVLIGDKQKYVLAEIDGYLGEICLRKGLNGNYQIDNIGHGTNHFRGRIVELSDQHYFKLSGRNIDHRIHTIVFSMAGYEYEIPIPAKDPFITVTEVDESITYFGGDSLSFYNAAGKDITSQIER